MSSDDTAAPAPIAPPPAPRRRVRRALTGLVLSACALVGLVVVLGVAGYHVLGTQRALDYLVERAVRDSNGHLTIEGAQGSLLSTVNVSRLAWTGEGMNVEAREAALSWSPWDLLSRRLVVQGLGARTISLEFKPRATGGTSGLPASLALPLEVEIRNIGVQRLEWRTPTQSGYVSGITFGYAGGATAHAIRNLRFVTQWGTLEGDARLGALPPFTVESALSFTGDDTYREARADLAVSGTLEELGIGFKGTWREANVSGKAAVTPFASTILTSADIEANAVDLARFLDNLPTTALSLTASARPEGKGFAGTLSARNAAPGPIDASRIPVTSLSTAFAWDGTSVALTQLDAALGERGTAGRATGTVTVTTPSGPVRLYLALANVDASRLLTTLIATRLSGTLAADVEEARQVVRADLRQDDLAARFTATVANRRVTVDRLEARAGQGMLTGRASLGLDAPRAFTVDAAVTKFDPSRFVAMPAATLDGTVRANGRIERPFAIHADVAVAKGSRLAGLDFAGTAVADAAPGVVRNAKIDVALGGSKVVMNGGYGTPADSLTYDVAIAKLAELVPLVERYAQDVKLPKEVQGALRARGKVAGEPSAPGVTLDARASKLVWGTLLRADTIDAVGSLASGGDATKPLALESRALKLEVTATGLAVPQATFARLVAGIDGTLAKHRLTLQAKSGDIDAAASASGGVTELRSAAGPERGWVGSIDSFTNKGVYAVTLLAPATLTASARRTELGSASIAVAEGRLDIAKISLDEGRIDTQGRYTAIPVAVLARLAGHPLPFRSTLVIGGNWSLAATPRLNGTLTLARESGDWYGAESSTLDVNDLALGISALDVNARFTDDALAATARLRSTRAGTADASFELAAGSSPGRIDAGTAFTAKLAAEIASLRPLQPWLGTTAVIDGRLGVDVTGRGTLGDPVVNGTLTGDALRFDLPQYGVQMRDGILRARLAERTITLDDLSFAGGAGRFKATGTIVGPARGQDAPTSRVQWQAKDFTIVNRPDLQLVADGRGTLSFEDRKIALAGDIDVVKGRVEYEPTRVGRLSDDVVIVGEPRRTEASGPLPLGLDLQVALGRDFRFAGEGLDTRLAGKVHVVTTGSGALAANGTINAVAGTYYLFGQRLDIDRGRLIFDGPVANPALDVVALRKNLAVEAGVEISGTVRQPRVRLVSNPPVPDGEKLSWILTGQGLDRASRNDIALLGAASASLLGGNNRPITTQIANTFGLDDISVQNREAAVTGGTSTQVVAFGKRISDRLTLVYEQGLTVASNALRIEYALSRTLTLRAEAGFVSSVGLFYRRSFD